MNDTRIDGFVLTCDREPARRLALLFLFDSHRDHEGCVNGSEIAVSPRKGLLFTGVFDANVSRETFFKIAANN